MPPLAGAEARWLDDLEWCAQGGLSLGVLCRLDREASDPKQLPWIAADLRPPALSLVLSAADVAEATAYTVPAAEQAVLDAVTSWLGIPMPELAIEVDKTLDAGRIRLRIGNVRGPALPATAGDASSGANWMQSALFHYLRAEAWRLLDVGTVLQLLLIDERIVPSLAGELLAESDALVCAMALRNLLRAGFGILDGASLCEDLLLPSVEQVGRTSTLRNVVLPSAGRARAPGAADSLAARLRAATLPRHLLRTAWREGDRIGHDVWTIDGAMAEQLRNATAASGGTLSLDDLEVCTWHTGLLILPADLHATVRRQTQSALPQLRVVDIREIPPELTLRRRGRISPARISPTKDSP